LVFVLSKLFWMVARPSVLLLVLACIGLALTFTRRLALGQSMLLAGLAGLLAIVALPVDQWALRPLEDRFAPVSRPPQLVDGIIVLGGAINEYLTADRGRPSLNGSAERMTEFVALARRYPNARLVFTGGSGHLAGEPVSEADGARPLFDSLGLAPARVVFENASRNTYENAVLSRRKLDPIVGQTWLLVTSASHMPRSIGVFRRAGWPVLAWPVAYKSAQHISLLEQVPVGDKITAFDWAVHEWIGLVAYRLLGWTDALFPAPESDM
jgi:uncharacterized SAM-binding protein YcdF (DUF218 family)